MVDAFHEALRRGNTRSALGFLAEEALIFEAGLSTARQVTAISGRGVGMDVVRSNIERIGGIASPAELSKATLLRSALEPWKSWFEVAGLDWPEPARGPLFTDLGILALPKEYHTPRIPGFGEIDWAEFMAVLYEVGYAGPVCIEVEDGTFGNTLEGRKSALRVARGRAAQGQRLARRESAEGAEDGGRAGHEDPVDAERVRDRQGARSAD